MKRFSGFLALFLLSIFIHCQEVENIFLDDTVYYSVKSGDGYYSYCYELNDSLPDGMYILYDVNRDEESNPNKRIIAKCQYTKNKKQGVYERSPIIFPSLRIISSYSNGIKNGSEDIYYLNKSDSNRLDLVFHGEYYNGMRDGVFIYYNKFEKIDQLMIYNNDSLVKLIRYGIPIASFNKFDQILIDLKCQITYTKFFYNAEVSKIEFHISNGILIDYVLYYIDGEVKMFKELNINTYFTNPLKLPISLAYISLPDVISKQKLIEYFASKELSPNYILLNEP